MLISQYTLNSAHAKPVISQEALQLPKEEKLKEDIISNSFSRNPEERRKKQAALHKRVSEKLNSWKRGLEEDLKNHETQVELMSADARRTFRRKQMKLRTQLHESKSTIQDSDSFSDLSNGKQAINGQSQEQETQTAARVAVNSRPSVLTLFYYEDLDLMVSGYEDCKIRKLI
jgi:hypothetical protein